MDRSGTRLGILGLALVLAACEPRENPTEANRQAKIDKQWPVPPPAGNAGERFWRFEAGRLVLWEPDPMAPPPIPGRALLSLRCDGATLRVETDIMVASDVPLPGPPFDTLTLESGAERLATKLTPIGNGYTSWAAGGFPMTRDQVERLLTGPVLVVRPLHTGDAQMDRAGDDFGEQYAAPPAELRNALLDSCGLPGRSDPTAR